MPERYVVCGPPGSGKSTWVEQRRKPGDVVFDADDLTVEMTRVRRYTFDPDFEFVAVLRAALVTYLQTHALRRNVYLVVMNETDAYDIAQSINARLITLAVPADECKRRLHLELGRADRLEHMSASVDRWWEDHVRAE